MAQYRWWIMGLIDGFLLPRPAGALPPRPAGARPEDGDPFRPWYKQVPHVHTRAEDGVLGAHVYASSEEEASAVARVFLARQEVVAAKQDLVDAMMAACGNPAELKDVLARFVDQDRFMDNLLAMLPAPR